MKPFEGKKFFCVDEEVIYDEFGYPKVKPHFVMTRSYRKYLAEKAEEEKQQELQYLKNSLEYQYKTYGEVDKIDFDRYVSLINAR